MSEDKVNEIISLLMDEIIDVEDYNETYIDIIEFVLKHCCIDDDYEKIVGFIRES